MAPGMLSRTFHHQRLLLAACGILDIPLALLWGRVATLLQLAAVTGALWFLGGVIFSQAATLIGLEAEPGDRGTAFGILGMTNGMGSLLGGLSVGYLADQFGYRGAFDSLAAFCVLIIVGGLVSVAPPASLPREPAREAQTDGRQVGGLLMLLLISQILLAVVNGTGNLGRSFSMNAGGFSKSAITMTAAIQGLVSLALPLVVGLVSDRIGRRWALIGSYAITGASLILLAFSQSMWQFCAFSVIFSFFGVSQAIGPAYVVDLNPGGNVGRGVSLLQSMFWVGSIAGMASTGYAIDKLGINTPILVSGFFPVAAAILLLFRGGRARTAGAVS